MTLFRYFLRKFLWTFLLVFSSLGLFYYFLDIVETTRRFGSSVGSVAEVFGLSALRLPDGLYQILPLTIILTSLAMFLALSRSSELVITRAAGRSGIRSLAAPIFGAFALGVVTFAAINPIVAATKTQYLAKEAELSRGVTSVLSISRNGLWLRQGDERGTTVIRASGADDSATNFTDVSFVVFDETSLPALRIEAEEAHLEQGAWRLVKAKRWALSPGTDVEERSETAAELTVPSSLTPENIREGFADPNSMPWWELPTFIANMENAGFSARRHKIWFQAEIAKPVLFVGMLLIGAAFTMQPSRTQRKGWMIVIALGLGFGFYFVGNFARILGENGQIPIALAAWAPPVASVLFALGILFRLEDG